jgi:RimJ/RimL family protein N-acetyltransferase
MDIRLELLPLESLRLIEGGASGDGDVRFEEGALPPSFITSIAVKALEAGHEVLWSSYFLFVAGGSAVGSGGFRGVPINGRVEIGYGVAPSFQRQGIASQAVVQLVELAFGAPGVREVFAETSVANIASRRVVDKAGFRHIGQRDSQDDGLVDQWLIVKPL